MHWCKRVLWDASHAIINCVPRLTLTRQTSKGVMFLFQFSNKGASFWLVRKARSCRASDQLLGLIDRPILLQSKPVIPISFYAGVEFRSLPKHNITSCLPYSTLQIWQRTMTCLYRLLIVGFALNLSPWSGKDTEASTIVKNGTSEKNLDSNIVNRLSFPSRRVNSRQQPHTSQKKEDASTDSSSTVKNGSTSIKLQREILNLLGLPRRPRLSLNTRLHGRKMSAPRYMIDLYNSLENNVTVASGDSRFCCNDSLDSRVSGADTIMSYLNHG